MSDFSFYSYLIWYMLKLYAYLFFLLIIKNRKIEFEYFRYNPPHCCVSPKPWSWSSAPCVVVYFVCSTNSGERWSFALLILVKLLTITIYCFFSYYSYLLSNAKSNLIKHKKWVRIFDILNETRIMDDKERLKIPEE